jgi:hypothetical protein
MLSGCASESTQSPLEIPRRRPIIEQEIRGTFSCVRPGLCVIYCFMRNGAGLATIDTGFGEESPAPVTSDSDEQVVNLVLTIGLSWKLTPPNFLTVDIPWPDEAPQRHYLRVERLESGEMSLNEMQTPTGPDLGLVFHFDHADILDQ